MNPEYLKSHNDPPPMPFNLLNPTTEVRIIRAALVMEIFTLPQLARFAGIKIRTLRSMFSRHLDHFEVHPAQLGHCRGAQSKVYQLTSAALAAYEKLAGPVQMPPSSSFESMLEAAAMALAAAEYALQRAKEIYAPFKERQAHMQAAWSHCHAADESLQLASRLVTCEQQRQLVAQNRCVALQVLRRLVRSSPT